MIASLRGVVDAVTPDGAVIDVGGVGYQIFASARTLAALPAPGQQASLAIETHVREDHIHLYGFSDRQERDWFRLLTTVQGVGARVALAILSVLSADALATAVAAQDKAALARADGVGPKLAARIVNELKDRTDALGLTAVSAPAADGAGATPSIGPANDAVSALVNLGYGRSEAFSAVNRAAQALGSEAGVESLIKAGLQELGA